MGEAVASVVRTMQSRLDGLTRGQAHLGEFLGTYLRTTLAVGKAVDAGEFEDPEWVERWDVAFAELYLTALDTHLSGAVPSRPWRLAFDAPPDLPALRHVLLGINAHVNYDLPQALLAVISDDDFTDASLMATRRRDHERIDSVLAGRVAAEDAELSVHGRTLTDRLLQPLNRLSSRRFLREARTKVWHNTEALQAARADGSTAYDLRLGELEVLSAARIADLLAPGQVLLRLAVAGFGVVLPPPA
ncbi:MAG TPA: DUF5995 family protein [Nocardioides sp.]|jgi:hypothetical protein|nr:DUF5995 family protein [Nocardioides sp.]